MDPPPYCPLCPGIIDDTEHLIRTCPCHAYKENRKKYLGEEFPDLTVLTTRPLEVVKYLKAIGRWDTAELRPHAHAMEQKSKPKELEPFTMPEEETEGQIQAYGGSDIKRNRENKEKSPTSQLTPRLGTLHGVD